MRVMQDGVTYHETQTFDRRPAATTRIQNANGDIIADLVFWTEATRKFEV